jgi:hypothetical protein
MKQCLKNLKSKLLPKMKRHPKSQRSNQLRLMKQRPKNEQARKKKNKIHIQINKKGNFFKLPFLFMYDVPMRIRTAVTGVKDRAKSLIPAFY